MTYRKLGHSEEILLHACCAHCAAYPVTRLREQGLEVTTLWYNPNIHPFMEHQRRLQSMQAFAQAVNVPLIVAEGFEMVKYFRTVVGHEAGRCRHCYRLRLSKTAEVAREKGHSAFSTTLLISPYQNHELIRQVGEEVAREQGVEFYYEDFRVGFKQSRQMTQELDLYRQKYCGCVYSEWERYAKFKISQNWGE